MGYRNIALLWLITAGMCYANTIVKLSPHVSVCQSSSVNSVFIESNGMVLAVYGDSENKLQKADMVLFTHCRRDVVWAGRRLVENGAESVVPASESNDFLEIDDFWTSFAKSRYHDYEQQANKILTQALRVDRRVSEGDSIRWQNTTIKVMDTPGYTRGSVSYIATIDGIKYGFVGDMIYGDGQLLDLYSLQDAVPEVKVWGYHGYAARLSDLIRSLRNVLEQDPDILVPIRGPVIRNPRAAIELLIKRSRRVYENYLAINAGHWYFKDSQEFLARRVLDPNTTVDWMPYAATIEKSPPSWIVPVDNARLLISEDKTAFLIDCGYDFVFKEILELRNKGRFTGLDGFFITHYHNDHTDWANKVIQEFKCPAYTSQIVQDILEHPEAYRLPAMTSEGEIRGLTVVPNGYKMRWKEFNLTFYDFPGQTIYHAALLVEKDNGEKFFFIGDSFSPSGIDDYCMKNRNLLHQGMGYFYCLDFLQKIPSDCMLIGQHVFEPFRFSDDQIKYMIGMLKKRKQLLADLFPWDEPNYGIDEQWARLYPYSQKAKAGERLRVTAKIFNHSDTAHSYTISLNIPEGFKLETKKKVINIMPREEGLVNFEVTVKKNALKKNYLITSDVQFDKWDLHHWCEAMIEICSDGQKKI